MARTTHEQTKVYWLDTCVDIEAPTAGEITAGDDLTGQVPVDGVEFSPSRNTASQAMLGDAFVAEKVGTWGESITLTFVRDDESDAARGLFASHGLDGFLLLSRYGTPAAGSVVEVYPVEAHMPADLATAENEFSKFQVTFAVTDTPAKNAVVASA